jgi:acyl-CoA thioester hydrolase
MTYEDYKHIIPIQVRFCDIDKLNHVNNSCYHNYVELGRVTYFHECLKENINWNKLGFILARTEINHIIPVHLNDEIFCGTKLLRFGNKSATFKNCILKKVNGKLIACASVIGVLVAMDYEKNLSIRVPELWRNLMLSFEK